MRRDQLEHAIRASCELLKREEVIIVGSQAILGSYDERQLPNHATMSLEVDILPISDNRAEVEEMADLLESVAGEFSLFEETHGFSIDGVDLSTATLPDGWRDRLVKVQNANTAPLAGTPEFTGWCLEKHDLCASKLCALREKDINFVSALLDNGLVDAPIIADRLRHVPSDKASKAEAALSWLTRHL